MRRTRVLALTWKWKKKHHGTVETLGSRRRPWDERAQFFHSVVIFPSVKMKIDLSVPVRVRVSNF